MSLAPTLAPTAYSVTSAGYSDPKQLFLDLVSMFKGTYVPSSLTSAVVQGSAMPFFVSAPGSVDMLNSLSPTLAVFLQSTSYIDSYLTVAPSQTYNILLKLSTVPSANQGMYVSADLSIAYGTTANFSLSGSSNTQADQISPSSVCPQIDVLGTATLAGGFANNLSPGIPSWNNGFNLITTFTNRGFALSCFPAQQANMVYGNSFLCIQRPVNPSTGIPNTAGDAPIFSLARDYTDCGDFQIDINTNAGALTNNLDSNLGFRFSTLRSLTIPSAHVASWTTGDPSINTSDWAIRRPCLYRLSMDWNHPNLFDNFTHVIKFPYGFYTTYHLYLDEMDLICLVNAMAFVTGQSLSVTMYGETDGSGNPLGRTYTTTYGECEFAKTSQVIQAVDISRTATTGARLALLTNGKEFT
jgi:hypothetical protein